MDTFEEPLPCLGARSRRPAISITVSQTVNGAIESDTWDDFAQRCATSYQCAHAYLRGWALKNRFRLRLFEIFMQKDGPPQKIGQCAVGVGGAISVFLGELQLLNMYSGHWTSAMTDKYHNTAFYGRKRLISRFCPSTRQ